MFSHIPSCPGVRRSSDDSSGCSRGSAAYSGCNRHTHTATETHAPAARRRITAAPLRTMLSMSTADRSRNSQACPPKVPGPFPRGGGGSPSNTRFLRPIRVHIPNDTPISSAVSAGLQGSRLCPTVEQTNAVGATSSDGFLATTDGRQCFITCTFCRRPNGARSLLPSHSRHIPNICTF